MTFDDSVHAILQSEGGWSNDKRDSGGETMYGITEFVARQDGYSGDMRDLTEEQAKGIYRRRFWDLIKGDAVAALSEAVAAEMFDTAVNQGVSRAVEYLQRALNVFSSGPSLKVDGAIGPVTLAALTAMLQRRGKQGEVVLVRALNGLQCAFYIDLAERRQKDEAYVYGWILNRVS